MSHSDNWTAELLLLFEEAFGSSVSSPVGLLEQATTVDVIELAPEGLRIRYSPETALWLSQVAEQPHDTAPIFRHLTMCLSNARHPLGRVCASFLALYHRMCTALGPRRPAARAVGALKLGCARLHRLVLDVLPPLQHAACARVAREAIQTVVFEGEGGTARALYAEQLADDDAALATRQAALRGLRPRHSGCRRNSGSTTATPTAATTTTRAAIRASTLGFLTRRRSPTRRRCPSCSCHATSSSSFATRARGIDLRRAPPPMSSAPPEAASRCYWAPTIWCR